MIVVRHTLIGVVAVSVKKKIKKRDKIIITTVSFSLSFDNLFNNITCL